MRLLNNNEMAIINGAGEKADQFQAYGVKFGGMLDSIFSKDTPRFTTAFGTVGFGIGSILEGQIMTGISSIIKGFGLIMFPAELPAQI